MEGPEVVPGVALVCDGSPALPWGDVMRWRAASLCVLSLVGLLGCPHSFGREGTIDRAARKDTRSSLAEEDDCPSREQVREACQGKPKEECYPECER